MKITATSRFVPGDVAGLLSRIRGGAQQGVERAGASCLQQAQVLVPIDTGALYESGYTSPGELSVDVGFTKEYAPFVEFGTYKMAAQPYLRPSLDSHHQVLIENVSDGIREALK